MIYPLIHTIGLTIIFKSDYEKILHIYQCDKLPHETKCRIDTGSCQIYAKKSPFYVMEWNATTFLAKLRESKNMSWDEEETVVVYHVVVNHEEQYSIWPDYKEVPGGWRTVGKTGSKSECLAYIKEIWTDMRPLSLRKQMAEVEGNRNQR
ncbi:MAG TPA: MbtH family NRPS accessory protein [Nitrosomonas sp.]|nr:MbtH family NRPS accessory protein [Nitrosomonas sp.]